SATKRSAELSGLDKDYRGTIRFGTITETWDLEGKVLSENPVNVTREALERAVASMRGVLTITPPAYSALKKGGRRLYALARQGAAVEPAAREVTIGRFEVENFSSPEAFFSLSCSK